MRKRVVGTLLVLLSASSFLYYHDYQQRQEMQSREMFDTVMIEKMEELYTQAKDWEHPLDFDIEDDRLSGEYAIVSEYMLNYWKQNVERRNQYLRSLETIGWTKFLDIHRLEVDKNKDYAQSERILEQVKKITADFQSEQSKFNEDTLNNIEQLEISDDFKGRMSEKLRKNFSDNDDQALLEMELRILENVEQMFDLLKENEWTSNQSQFLFKKSGVIKQFNLLYVEIIEFEAQIKVLKQRNAKALETMFN